MGTIDIKNFPAHEVCDQDSLLMTDAKSGFGPGSTTIKKFKENVLIPLIESLCLNYDVLTMLEYEALETKKPGVLYVVSENGKLVKTSIGSLPLTSGETLFRSYENHWQITKDGGTSWDYLFDNTGRKVRVTGETGEQGPPGNPAVLRKSGNHVQFLNGEAWENLYYIPEFTQATEVVNELGQSVTAAVSQKLFTDTTFGTLKYNLTTLVEYENLATKTPDILYCCVEDGCVMRAYLGKYPFLLFAPPVTPLCFPYTFPLVLT